MSPDDERWPAVREAARRILRTPLVRLAVEPQHMTGAHNLVTAIAEANPAQLSLPEVVESGTNFILDGDTGTSLVTWTKTEHLDALLFQNDGPFGVNIEDVFSMAHGLVEAGYPGCLGCGGPGLEAPWDELAWRTRQNTTSFK
ncbi:MAG: hypothetical protein QF839_05615 [Candidatus Poseidoniaceae archaeon]|nr:hypothetical protein [Candidatus Poseidoniaceae archaeon]